MFGGARTYTVGAPPPGLTHRGYTAVKRARGVLGAGIFSNLRVIINYDIVIVFLFNRTYISHDGPPQRIV